MTDVYSIRFSSKAVSKIFYICTIFVVLAQAFLGVEYCQSGDIETVKMFFNYSHFIC